MKRRAAYVVVLLLGLAAPKVWAEIEQVRLGFRPLRTSPTRVAYSWDMFSTPVERCDVHWDPPLPIDGRAISQMSERGAPIEFDTVYDSREDYRGFAEGACSTFAARGPTPTTITLRCARMDGTVEETRELCP